MEKKLLEKATYQQQTVTVLEKMIVSGELKPGQKLSESELAASLGISRSPVREAIIQLSFEGLIRTDRKGGRFVSEISLQDIIELYDLRKMIEVYAGKLGCLNCSREIIDEMKAVNEDCKAGYEDIEIRREKNWRFHELIVLSCGNRKLHETFTRVVKSLRWCSHLPRISGRQDQSYLEHKRILDFFLRRDRESLEGAITEHIEIVQKNLRNRASMITLTR